MTDKIQYMVEFDILYELSEEMINLIPAQRREVNKLFHQGFLISYTLNAERTKLWAIFEVDNESKLIMLIDGLPMTSFMDYYYHELTFHNTLNMIPSISLN